MQDKSGVYIFKNKVNNRVYVGSTVRLNKRKYEHFHYLEKNKHRNPHLQLSYHKYGKENFEFIVLEEVEESLLGMRESFWIAQYNALDSEYGYNKQLAPLSHNRSSEETKKKISMSNKGSGIGDKNSMFGKKHTTQAKANMGKNHPDFKGGNHPGARSVVQLNLNDEFIAMHPAIVLAGRATGINCSSIGLCCKEKDRSIGGFKWMYLEEYNKMLENTNESQSQLNN